MPQLRLAGERYHLYLMFKLQYLSADQSCKVLRALYGEELEVLPPREQLESVLLQPGPQQHILVSRHIWDKCAQEGGSAEWLSMFCRQQHCPGILQRDLDHALESPPGFAGNEGFTLHSHLGFFSDILRSIDELLPVRQQLNFVCNENSSGQQQTSGSATIAKVSI